MNTLRARLQLARDAGFTLAVDTRIPLDGVTAIYGPSGCGKTTLLYALAGLLSGDGGSEVYFRTAPWLSEGRSLPLAERHIGFVFQDARLFPHLDVRGNLDFARQRTRGRSGPGQEEVCDWLGITDLLDRPVQSLSRGQEQRVAIARALLSAPDILFLDEPLANLDLAARASILRHLETLRRQLAIPVVYVSHDMEELSRLADWLLVMEAGAITAEGPLIDLSARLELALAHEEQAAAILVAEFETFDSDYGLGRLNFEGQTLWVAALEAPPGTRLRLRVPARDVSLCLEPPGKTSILNVLQVEVAEIEHTAGPRVLLRLQAGQQSLLARITRKSLDALGLSPGDTVYAQIKSVALLSESDA